MAKVGPYDTLTESVVYATKCQSKKRRPRDT